MFFCQKAKFSFAGSWILERDKAGFSALWGDLYPSTHRANVLMLTLPREEGGQMPVLVPGTQGYFGGQLSSRESCYQTASRGPSFAAAQQFLPTVQPAGLGSQGCSSSHTVGSHVAMARQGHRQGRPRGQERREHCAMGVPAVVSLGLD